MPLSGSGSYSAPASSWNPAVANTPINSTDWAALLADLSTALSTAMYKDGQQIPTANLPMGGFKLTGLAAGSTAGNSVRYEQIFPALATTTITLAGPLNEAKTTVASAAGADIWTAIGNVVDWTGTVTATSFAAAPQAGSRRTLVCAAAAPFTAGANFLIDGYASGSTYTAAAGDAVDVIALTTTQFRLKPRPISGLPVVGTSIPRSYLAGLTLSTAGSSATMSIAAGQATDSTNVAVMNLAAIAKTTSAWAVGTGNGGKMSAAALAAGWYHFYEIMRVDTGVVDAGFDTSATAPTMPSGYTLFRRIGSAKNDGTNWLLFTQDGDYFRWSASVRDVNDANPGISSLTKTLASSPTGINAQAIINAGVSGATGSTSLYVRDLAASDEAPNVTAAPIFTAVEAAAGVGLSAGGGMLVIRTNTSAQIGYRLSFSDANTIVAIATLGWYDSRGRNS